MRSISSGERGSPTNGLDARSKARRVGRPTIWSRLVVGVVAVLSLGVFATGASAEETPVTFPGGPLTVSTGPLGQCQSSYENHGNNYYPPTGNIGDCGFFLAFPEAGNTAPLLGQTYGFNGAALFGFGEAPSDLYEPSSQSPVTGSGTAASPYTETTVFSVNEVGKPSTHLAKVTETTTYVNGEPQFISTYTVKNERLTTIHFRAMYAGDLFVNGDDHGTGVYLAGPPQFIGGLNAGQGVVGGFEEAPGALPWSSFQELDWPEIWSTVESTVASEHAFNKTIEPAEVDNAAGVEWDQLREGTGLEAGKEQAFTIINRTSIPSNLQISPTSQTLTQGQTETINVTALDLANEPYAGKSVHYTVSGANPQSGAVTLNSAGQAQISYVGHNAGVDTTQLYVDLVGNGVQAAGDPAGDGDGHVHTAAAGPHPQQHLQSPEHQSQLQRDDHDRLRPDPGWHGESGSDGADGNDCAQRGDRSQEGQEVQEDPDQGQRQVPAEDHGLRQGLGHWYRRCAADADGQALGQDLERPEEGQDSAPHRNVDLHLSARWRSHGGDLPLHGQGQAEGPQEALVATGTEKTAGRRGAHGRPVCVRSGFNQRPCRPIANPSSPSSRWAPAGSLCARHDN